MKKILIVDRVHANLIPQLTELGYFCVTNLQCSYNEFINYDDEYEILIIRSSFILDKNLLSTKKNLKVIIRLGAGVEHIDVEFAKLHGIRVITTPEANAPAVAEHCLAMLLCVLKKVHIANNEVKNGFWLREKNKGTELSSQTVGIIGFGNTGQAFAKLLHHFGCKILVYDKYKSNFDVDYVQEVTLKELQEDATVISIHINYIETNYHFVDTNFFRSLDKKPILINSSRGLVLDTIALIIAINQQLISFTALDVLEFENVNLQIPEKENWDETMIQLSQQTNVLLTPHTAGQTQEAEARHAIVAVKKLFSQPF